MNMRSPGKKKNVILIISLALLLAATIGGTAAYLLAATERVTNTFRPAEVTVTINEDKTATTKSNISFTNPQTEKAVPVYIRATLVINWTDTVNGTEAVIAPPADSSVTLGSLLNGWFQVGDIYYYPGVIAPGGSTPVLMNPITVTLPDGSTAKCHIDIHAEAIQADPAAAVEEAWLDVNVNSSGDLVAAG